MMHKNYPFQEIKLYPFPNTTTKILLPPHLRRAWMGTSTSAAFLLLFAAVLLPCLTLSAPVTVDSVKPNFTASYLNFVDNSGAFLSSKNNNFQARIANSRPEATSFYFVIVHVSTNTIVWSANRNEPISQSSQLRLTGGGLTLYNDSGQPIWSTPENLAGISSMRLRESGNLVLLDFKNDSLWESFDYPTDVLVMGQKLPAGKFLVSSADDEDLSAGNYRLIVDDSDAVLQWNSMDYWKLSMDKNSYRDTNFPVDYMVMNFTGVYLMGQSGGAVVVRLILHNSDDDDTVSASDFKILKLDHKGVFSISRFNSNGDPEQEFAGPDDTCRIPFICRQLGVCTNGGSCQCAPSFYSDPKRGDCVPTDHSLSLPSGYCNYSENSVNYLSLRNDLDYFSNDFTDPVANDVNLTSCQNLCSKNCSCLGVFYSSNSGSCYMIKNYLGSMLVNSGPSARLGYVKTIAVRSSNGFLNDSSKSKLPVLAAVLLPSSGVIIVALVGTLIWLRRRRTKWKKYENPKLARDNSSSSVEDGMDNFISIPGLPVKFDYQELDKATGGFVDRIGSGGFGTVYKGKLENGSDIAVKKITCLGSRGTREFLTEIAVIGNIHHVNLVRLKGFCSHRGQKFLVYEYMNRGSLDRTLFGGKTVLDWKERYEIALGTARGLAYLHSGCDHKIIHCDVKPENILLHEKSQVKISDFGLSKLLNTEESCLFTTLRGTRGYLAPEWLTSSAISDRTDVYSYGMVLLEIIRGRKNSSHNSTGTGGNPSTGQLLEENGPRPVYFPLLALEKHEEGRYMDLVDPRLGGRVRGEDVEKLVKIALCCVHEEPNLRPTMTNVVGMLEGGVALGEPKIDSLNFLRFYGRRFTEASTLGEPSEGDEEVAMVYRQQQSGTNTSSSYNSFSYMSSQDVSGPR